MILALILSPIKLARLIQGSIQRKTELHLLRFGDLKTSIKDFRQRLTLPMDRRLRRIFLSSIGLMLLLSFPVLLAIENFAYYGQALFNQPADELRIESHTDGYRQLQIENNSQTRYAAAAMHHLAGNLDRAARLYQQIPEDDRAHRNLNALQQGRIPVNKVSIGEIIRKSFPY